MNESQKPACNSAHGSNSVTTKPASSSTISHGQQLPDDCSNRDRREHPHGTLRRHAPAREHRICSRRREAAPTCRQRRRQEDRQPRAAAPERGHHRTGEPGKHRDVNTADRHQVRHAGVAIQIPVVARNGLG